MDETIEDIIAYIKKKTKDFSYPDQAMMYDELASKLCDMNADALKSEYLGSDDYLLDIVCRLLLGQNYKPINNSLEHEKDYLFD